MGATFLGIARLAISEGGEKGSIFAENKIVNFKNKIMEAILRIALWIYVSISQICAIVFWWRMMKQDSFFEALLIDPIIAELKAIVWPFFI